MRIRINLGLPCTRLSLHRFGSCSFRTGSILRRSARMDTSRSTKTISITSSLHRIQPRLRSIPRRTSRRGCRTLRLHHKPTKLVVNLTSHRAGRFFRTIRMALSIITGSISSINSRSQNSFHTIDRSSRSRIRFGTHHIIKRDARNLKTARIINRREHQLRTINDNAFKA